MLLNDLLGFSKIVRCLFFNWLLEIHERHKLVLGTTKASCCATEQGNTCTISVCFSDSDTVLPYLSVGSETAFNVSLGGQNLRVSD